MRKLLTLVCAVFLSLSAMAGVPGRAQKAASPAQKESALRTKVAAKPAPSKLVVPKARKAKAASARVSGMQFKANSFVPFKNRIGSLKQGPFSAAAANLPNMIGNVIYADGWSQGSTPGAGLNYLPKSAAGEFTLISEDASSYRSGGVVKDGVYYGTSYMTFWGMVYITADAIDIETGEVLYTIDTEDLQAVPLAQTLDPTTNTIYGVTYNATGDGVQLTKMDYSESGVSCTTVASMTQAIRFLACDAQGQLWGVTQEWSGTGEEAVCTGSKLVKINKATAEITEVGTTGLQPQYISGMAFDHKSGRLFWTVSGTDESGVLAEINTTTGQATILFHYPNEEEIIGLTVLAPAAEDKAPAAVENLALNFANGSTSGTVSFKAPSTLFDGTAGSGSLTYYINVDGQQKSTGSCNFSQAVSENLTLEAGSHNIEVYTTNSVGASPKVSKSIYIGNDQPKAPAAVNLVYEGGQMKLSWDAVTEGANGGYISAVTYKVERVLPSAAVVAENISATSFAEAVAEPENFVKYQYKVTAQAASVASEPSLSNAISLGNIVPPYYNDFNDDTALENFTILDLDGDGKSWKIEDGSAKTNYNSSQNPNDWMITPAMKLEAGKMYHISFKAHNSGATFPEKLKVMLGKQPTEAAMTQTVLPETTIASNVYADYSADITVDADGLYYIGFNCCSDKDMYYLMVDDLRIEAGVSATAPDAPELQVIPDASGADKATVKITAPSKAISGAALQSISKIELYRGDALINTFSSVTPGQTLADYADQLPADGDYTYSAIAYNASGAGRVAEVNAYIGVNYPGKVASATVVENATPGEVTISWEPVTVDANGNPLRSDLVKYNLYAPGESGYFELFKENISGTSYVFQAVEAGSQKFVQYAVLAVTSRGEAEDGATTDMIPAGTPYDGMDESFADGSLSYILGISGKEIQFELGNDASYTDVASSDADNGFLIAQSQYGGTGSLFTGKISLAALTKPGLTINLYKLSDDDTNSIAIGYREVGTEEWHNLKTVVLGELPAEGWNKVAVDLGSIAGKTVQFNFDIDLNAYQVSLLDAIKVGNLLENDVKLASIQAPSSVKAGSDFSVDVTVANEGTQAAANINVDLYKDGEILLSKKIESLASGDRSQVKFPVSVSQIQEDPMVFHAVATHTGDADESNNTSDEITVTPRVNASLPVPLNLTGSVNENGAAELEWSEPDTSGQASQNVDENFEEAEAWAQEFEGWTFVDEDKLAVGGFEGLDIPGITPGETLASFFVFDTSDASMLGSYPDSFAAHSGNKYLASLFQYQGQAVSDWAISPALSGNAQTISFYARSYSAQYPEAIEILYSTGSNDISEFVSVKKVAVVPGEWTLYEFDVPQGATYFAIKSYAADSFMLMLDDFSFETSGGSYELKGYNVFRNGEMINSNLLEELSFVDDFGPNQENAYRVNAVYANGTSKGSNEVKLVTSGIDVVTGSKVSVYSAPGAILVKGAEGLNIKVYTVDGKLLYNADGKASTRIAVAPAVYVVKAGSVTAKVLVK